MNTIYVDFASLDPEIVLGLIAVGVVLFLGVVFAVVWLLRRK